VVLGKAPAFRVADDLDFDLRLSGSDELDQECEIVVREN
jgi:hypothetical protein